MSTLEYVIQSQHTDYLFIYFSLCKLHLHLVNLFRDSAFFFNDKYLGERFWMRLTKRQERKKEEWNHASSTNCCRG